MSSGIFQNKSLVFPSTLRDIVHLCIGVLVCECKRLESCWWYYSKYAIFKSVSLPSCWKYFFTCKKYFTTTGPSPTTFSFPQKLTFQCTVCIGHRPSWPLLVRVWVCGNRSSRLEPLLIMVLPGPRGL